MLPVAWPDTSSQILVGRRSDRKWYGGASTGEFRNGVKPPWGWRINAETVVSKAA
jgi:hypothetical protein